MPQPGGPWLEGKGGKLGRVALAVLVGQQEAHERCARREAALLVVCTGPHAPRSRGRCRSRGHGDRFDV
eukprot:1348564-Prymnesium_polylepis.1